jgi:hypothetical protein
MIDRALAILTAWFYTALAVVGAFLGVIDLALRHALARAGVPPDVQILVILLTDTVLIVLVAKTFGGLLRILLLVFLILLVMHVLLSTTGFDFARPLNL